MNKTELVAAIAEKAGVKKEDAKKMVDAFIGTVTETLVAEKKVVLVGFGTFETRTRGARTARNPQTGAAIKIAASKAPAFKAGSAFKDAVNK